MMKVKHILLFAIMAGIANPAHAQFKESGISAGFFDSSGEKDINFSDFHLPPLAVLFENAKSNPTIMSLAKAQEIAEAEVAHQKRTIFQNIRGYGSYSYGMTDVFSYAQMANLTTNANLYPTSRGTEQSYWNVGVSASLNLLDILDYVPSIRRKRLEVDRAQLEKDIAYENLKKEIASLYIKITNALVSLKTASENAAMYQGAGSLNREDFHQGNMSIENFAYTKLHEQDAVKQYQDQQTQITTDIITLEIMTRTPILTNSTTEITLDKTIHKTQKQINKENKAIEKRIKREAKEERKQLEALAKAEKKAKEAAEKAAKKN
jgi:hypothetical protein